MTAVEIELEDYGTRDAWLAARRTGIGASEVAALFGASPYHTPLSLWALKTGKLEQDTGESKLLKWGTRLEPAIAAGYEEDSGRKLWRASPYAVARHPRVTCMTATPDYFILSAPDRDGRGLVEIKNVNVWMMKEWEDGLPPLHIQIQAQCQLACTGYDYVTVAPLFGGNDDRPVDIERNEEFIAELEAQCTAFWRYVEDGEQPPADPSERTLETLKRLHPDDNGETVLMPVDAAEWWGHLQQAKATIKDAEQLKLAAEVALKDAIGPATFGQLTDGRLISLKTVSNPGHESVVEPFKYRVLREVKEERKRRR